MSARKLRLVGYHKVQVDFEDDSSFGALLCHLEEKFLKRRSAEWIITFLDEKDKEKWRNMLIEYLESCGINVSVDFSRRSVSDQLINLAIDQLYLQCYDAQKINSEVYGVLKKEKISRSENSQNPLNIMDCSDPSVKGHINDLCANLGISAHPNPEVRLRAACLFIQDNLSDTTMQHRKEEAATGKPPKTFALQEFPLGLADQKDSSLDTAARCLRLLSVESLRETQTKVNETLVAIQNITIEAQKAN